ALKDLASRGICVRRFQLILPGAQKPRCHRMLFALQDWWAMKVLDSADPDPWRRRFRAALFMPLEEQRTVWQQLGNEPSAREQPIRLLTHVATKVKSTQEALRLLKEAQQRRPNDLAVNMCLAAKLMEGNPSQVEEAVRFYTAAVALKPESSSLR